MAQQLYFSRDTRMFVQFRNSAVNTETPANLGAGALWEIPILDGYSFSQTTNTSEITLSEMESSAGISRRGRRMFTDSLAPAEWSFSTYVRPFLSKINTAGGLTAGGVSADTAAETHAVEEVLWAAMFGADTYTASSFTRTVAPVSGPVVTPGNATTGSILKLTESNRSAMTAFTIFFMIDTATSNPLVYRMPEAVVNEVSVDFDVDGIATLNWTGMAKEIQDVSGGVSLGTSAPAYDATTIDGSAIALGDVFVDTDNVAGRQFTIVNNVPGSGVVTLTAAIDEGTTSTKNFIRNRLTSVTIEAADATDKIPSVFPGNHDVITTLDDNTDDIITVTGHGFTTGDQCFITGCTGVTTLNGLHLFVRSVDANSLTLHPTKADAVGNTNIRAIDADGIYDDDSGTISNGKYQLTLTGGNFNIANNISYLVPEELGAINKPLEHVTGSRNSGGTATCYLALEDGDLTNGTSRQFFNDMVSTGAMSKVVNKFKVDMHIGGTAATSNGTDPALLIKFPTAHIEVPSHSIDDVISLETTFTALPTDFGTANEVDEIVYFPVDDYS